MQGSSILNSTRNRPLGYEIILFKSYSQVSRVVKHFDIHPIRTYPHATYCADRADPRSRLTWYIIKCLFVCMFSKNIFFLYILYILSVYYITVITVVTESIRTETNELQWDLQDVVLINP